MREECRLDPKTPAVRLVLSGPTRVPSEIVETSDGFLVSKELCMETGRVLSETVVREPVQGPPER